MEQKMIEYLQGIYDCADIAQDNGWKGVAHNCREEFGHCADMVEALTGKQVRIRDNCVTLVEE